MPPTRHLARRLFAVTIDSLLANALQLAALTPLVMIVSTHDMEHDADATVLAIVAAIIGLGGAFGIIVAFVLRDRWRSPGKRALGLDVVDVETGARCSLKQAAIRNGIYIALGIVDALIPLFRQDGRRLGDLAAGTRVIEAPR